MLKCLEHRSSNLRNQLAETCVPVNRHTHSQGIHKEADELLELNFLAIGDWGADDDVVLPAIAMEQHRICRQQCHEYRGAVLLAETIQRRVSLCCQPDRRFVGGIGLSWTAGSVPRQSELVEYPCQLFLPVRNKVTHHSFVNAVVSPQSEVCVLNRQWGQRIVEALVKCVVERYELAAKSCFRPA